MEVWGGWWPGIFKGYLSLRFAHIRWLEKITNIPLMAVFIGEKSHGRIRIKTSPTKQTTVQITRHFQKGKKTGKNPKPTPWMSGGEIGMCAIHRKQLTILPSLKVSSSPLKLNGWKMISNPFFWDPAQKPIWGSSFAGSW